MPGSVGTGLYLQHLGGRSRNISKLEAIVVNWETSRTATATHRNLASQYKTTTTTIHNNKLLTFYNLCTVEGTSIPLQLSFNKSNSSVQKLLLNHQKNLISFIYWKIKCPLVPQSLEEMPSLTKAKHHEQ